MRVDSVRPTDHQKAVLAIIASSPTSKVAAEEVTKDPNTKEAADILTKLGAVTFDGVDLAFTDVGEQLAQDENIVDMSGALTTAGTFYLKYSQHADQYSQEDQPEETLPMESYSLVKELLSLKG